MGMDLFNTVRIYLTCLNKTSPTDPGSIEAVQKEEKLYSSGCERHSKCFRCVIIIITRIPQNYRPPSCS